MQLFVQTSSAVPGENALSAESFPVSLSSLGTASVKCMLPVKPQENSHLRAWITDESTSSTMCDTRWVPLNFGGEGWSCLNSASRPGPGGSVIPVRLMTFYSECEGGWTLCFDVKEGLAEGPVLRNVHLALSSGGSEHEQSLDESILAPEGASTAVIKRNADQEGCLDCTLGQSVLHIAQQLPLSALTHMRPGTHGKTAGMLEQMLQAGSDGDLPSWLLEHEHWLSISRGLEELSVKADQMLDSEQRPFARPSCLPQLQKDLNRVGYGRLHGLCWKDAGVPVEALAQLMDRLKQHGFPPVFVFMYDQAWLLWERLFDIMAVVMDEVDVELDASVFAWALQPTGQPGAIGNNFGRPHRDDSYEECHTDTGKPSTISVWMPLVPVSTTNGCMYVVPSDCDPLFSQSMHPLHMSPDKQMPWSHIRPLPAAPGEVLLWHGNLIHWGAACDSDEQQPRKSIASAFMLPGSSEVPTISRMQLQAGLSLTSRLRLVLRALLTYEHWHPNFAGLECCLQSS